VGGVACGHVTMGANCRGSSQMPDWLVQFAILALTGVIGFGLVVALPFAWGKESASDVLACYRNSARNRRRRINRGWPWRRAMDVAVQCGTPFDSLCRRWRTIRVVAAPMARKAQEEPVVLSARRTTRQRTSIQMLAVWEI